MIDKTLVTLENETHLKWLEHVDLNIIYIIEPYLYRSDLTKSDIQLESMK
jgi:hypothetical protein